VTPFPYHGDVPDKNRRSSISRTASGAATRRSAAGTYWEDQTYKRPARAAGTFPKGSIRADRRSWSVLPRQRATLTRDVRNRQAVPRQVTESGLNAVLVAPQFAVNALDFQRRTLLGAGRVRAISA